MWYPVVGFENLYDVNEDGVIRNSRTDRIIPVKSGKVTLSKKGSVFVVPVKDIFADSVTEDAKSKIIELETKEKAFVKNDLTLFSDKKWSNGNDTKIIGDIGEHLVCIELLSRGIRSAMNIMEGGIYDVIGDFGNGRIFKIQVKTVKESKNGSYFFHADINYLRYCDVMAYVALDERMVVFELCDEISASSRKLEVGAFVSLGGRSIDTVVGKLFDRFERQKHLI